MLFRIRPDAVYDSRLSSWISGEQKAVYIQRNMQRGPDTRKNYWKMLIGIFLLILVVGEKMYFLQKNIINKNRSIKRREKNRAARVKQNNLFIIQERNSENEEKTCKNLNSSKADLHIRINTIQIGKDQFANSDRRNSLLTRIEGTIFSLESKEQFANSDRRNSLLTRIEGTVC